VGAEHGFSRIAAYGRYTILLGAVLLAAWFLYLRVASQPCLAEDCVWCRFAFIGIGVALIGHGGSPVAVAESEIDYRNLTVDPVVSYASPVTKPFSAARIMRVPSGTRATLLGVSPGMREVRILEGPHAGKRGYVKPSQIVRSRQWRHRRGAPTEESGDGCPDR